MTQGLHNSNNVVKLRHDALLVCKQLCVVTQVVAKKDVTRPVCLLPEGYCLPGLCPHGMLLCCS